MRCNNCGMDYIMDNASNCPRCGASLGQPGYQQPPQQYQQQPQQQYQPQPGQYQQPPQQYGQPYGQQGYSQPPLPKKEPTVRRIDMTGTLLIVSSLFLLQGGMWNLSFLTFSPSIFQILLGLVATAVSLLVLFSAIMPNMFKQMAEMMDMLVLALGAVFVLWGLVIMFTDDFGSAGDSVFVGGFGLLMASMLRMGLVK